MRTIQLIGGPVNGEYVAVGDSATEYRIVERLDDIDLMVVSGMPTEAKINVKHHIYRQSPDSDFIFYHEQCLKNPS